MPKLSPIVSLDRLLADLMKQRQIHVDALAKIEGVFAKYGIKPGHAQPTAAPVVEAEPAPTGAKKSRKRRKFATTADQFVLSMLAGGKNPTTGEINTAWTEEGRIGKADNTLSLLVKNKKIKRMPVKEGRGSKYALA